jgi:hypothetical protein
MPVSAALAFPHGQVAALSGMPVSGAMAVPHGQVAQSGDLPVPHDKCDVRATRPTRAFAARLVTISYPFAFLVYFGAASIIK